MVVFRVDIKVIWINFKILFENIKCYKTWKIIGDKFKNNLLIYSIYSKIVDFRLGLFFR